MLNIRWLWERRAEADARQHAVVEGCSVGKTCIGVVDRQTEADSSDGDGRGGLRVEEAWDSCGPLGRVAEKGQHWNCRD